MLNKKIYSVLCIMTGFFLVALLAEVIYFTVFWDMVSQRMARLFLNMGWLCLWGYAYHKFTQHYTQWWDALKDKNK